MFDRRLNHYPAGGAQVITAGKELDVYTAAQMRQTIIDLAVLGHYRLVVDLQPVTFLDSTGLATLVGGKKRLRAHDGDIAVACNREPQLVIFRITQLGPILNLRPTVAGAVVAATGDPAAVPMWAHRNAGGRWMTESVLCGLCSTRRENTRRARAAAEQAGDWDGKPPRDCSATPDLACIACGFQPELTDAVANRP